MVGDGMDAVRCSLPHPTTFCRTHTPGSTHCFLRALSVLSRLSYDFSQLHEVHGLTTAASLWLSAAVGVVIGGGMYFIGFFTVMVSILVLRFGPRSSALDVRVPSILPQGLG